MLATILGIAKGALALLAALAGAFRDKQLVDGGRAEQKAADQGAALEARKRMDEAGAEPHDDATISKRLRDGDF